MSKLPNHTNSPLGPSGISSESLKGPKRDDRREVGLIAAIVAVLALGVAGYWISEELEGTQAKVTSSDTTAVSPNWQEGEQKGEIGETVTKATSIAPPRPVPVTATASEDPSLAPSDQGVMNIYFDFDQSRLTDEAKTLLKEEVGNTPPGEQWRLVVQGHTDEIGSEVYNKTLGVKRAEAVKAYLITLGIPDTFVQVRSLGEAGAVCQEKTEACYHLNRRAQLEWKKEETMAVAPKPLVAAEQSESILSPEQATDDVLSDDEEVESEHEPMTTAEASP